MSVKERRPCFLCKHGQRETGENSEVQQQLLVSVNYLPELRNTLYVLSGQDGSGLVSTNTNKIVGIAWHK